MVEGDVFPLAAVVQHQVVGEVKHDHAFYIVVVAVEPFGEEGFTIVVDEVLHNVLWLGLCRNIMRLYELKKWIDLSSVYHAQDDHHQEDDGDDDAGRAVDDDVVVSIEPQHVAAVW